MPSGGRPVYTEDFQVLQNEISVFEQITYQNCGNCVLSGCVYTETPNPDGVTYNANLTEGYAIINGKICHVAAWHNAAFHHIQLPLYIELVQSDSVERTQLVNGETTPMTINYEGEVRTAGNTMAGPAIFMNRKKSSSSLRRAVIPEKLPWQVLRMFPAPGSWYFILRMESPRSRNGRW